MLNTVEQKLSAIKAINEAKEKVEYNLTMCAYIKREEKQISQIVFASEGGIRCTLFNMPLEIIQPIIAMCVKHLEAEQKNLIDKAQQLMK